MAHARKAQRKRVVKRKAPARRAGARSNRKTVIRAGTLGSQTTNKVRLTAGKPDSRAKVMNAVAPVNHFTQTLSTILSPADNASGRVTWGSTRLAGRPHLNYIGTRLAQQNLSSVDISGQGASSGPAMGMNEAPQRYLLNNVNHVARFSNFSQAACRLTVYHCRAKRDLYLNMNYTAPSGVDYPWTGSDILTGIQAGIAASVNDPAAPINSVYWYIPGTVPTESPIFNAYFEIHKETEVFMGIGSTHTLETNKHFDKVVDATVYGNTYMSGCLGYTEYLVYRVEGIVGEDAGIEGKAQLTRAQVGVYESYEYSFRQIQQPFHAETKLDAVGAGVNAVDTISASTGVGIADSKLQ